MRHSKRVPISRIAEKSGVFLEKKRLLESEKRHFQVLAHLWREESKLRNALCILYDNEETFGSKNSDIPHEISQFIPSAGVLEKAKELDMEKLESVDFLSKEEKEAVLLRRDGLIQAIEAYKTLP